MVLVAIPILLDVSLFFGYGIKNEGTVRDSVAKLLAKLSSLDSVNF
jgi:hypothetical protein